MAFPRPFNATASYYVGSPPYCDDTVLEQGEIPIRQLKDYLPYFDPETNSFYNRPLVRWAVDPVWVPVLAVLPALDDPEAGFFQLDGSPFTNNAYQIVGLEPIMTPGITPSVDYYYAILRQISPAEYACPAPGPTPVELPDDYTEAVFLEPDEPYSTTIPATSTGWFSIDNTGGGLVLDGIIEGISAAFNGTVEVFAGSPPVTPEDTYTDEEPWLALPSTDPIFISVENLDAIAIDVEFEFHLTTLPSAVTGGTTFGTAPTISPDTIIYTTVPSFTARWFKLDTPSAANFVIKVYFTAGTGTVSARLYWNQVSPTTPDDPAPPNAYIGPNRATAPIYLELLSSDFSSKDFLIEYTYVA